MSVQKMARERGEVAIGYMKFGQPPLINPPQNETQPYVAEDRIIVVSEDDSEAVGDRLGEFANENPLVPEVTPPSPRIPAAAAKPPPPAAVVRAPSPLVPVEPRPLEAQTVTAGPRIAGPSTQPRPPLPA